MKLLVPDSDTESVKKSLDTLLPAIKEIANNYKKIGVVAAE